MFSGIVQDIGIVEKLETKSSLLELSISSRKISSLKIGDSIAINGCCQTIVETSQHSFKVQATQETLSKTNFTKLKIDSKINLEPSLKFGEKLDGHLVLGHIDATGEVIDVLTINGNIIIKILFPKELKDFISPKGSISVNGVSLTVIEAKSDYFTFTLIPYTSDNTNLGLLETGDLVNLEVDLISRYLVNYLRNNYAIRA